MHVEKWHLLVIDLEIGQYYVLLENRSRRHCEELIREWDKMEVSNTIPLMWPTSKPIPESLLAG